MVVALAFTAGCDFSQQDQDRAAGQFSANDESIAVPQSQPPQSRPGGTESQEPPPPGPCVDPDPAVIATCLASTGGVRAGDDQGESTIVAERTTGKIITTKRYGPQRVVTTFPVDATGDGGLIDFAYSPTYDQDQLIYALITTGSDNRVVRIAPGDAPKPILTGIPKGATGNMGALMFVSPTELVVATGNAGDPAAAADPASLAGKLLVVSDLSSGSNARPKVLASGLGTNVALCPSSTGALYVSDQGPTEDRIQAVEESGTKVLWTWPDRPQIAGCAATGGQIFVSTTRTQQILAINEPTRDKPTINPPAVVLDKRYGALGRMTALSNGLIQFATVNRAYGKPVSTDDRVVRFIAPPPSEDRT
ncbi:PQQ-dependent sugar dehydrogenase [Gordonia sp. NB41Y]|uniref:PQQ-dependent sugar dehydrogenase n=1 Tax=Gordonia sp. NB41Y TaxID=875808 RepID=UPI0006B1E90A|nr:PQQ-dependent sugar dehydrogenase [Gordonia sp. NB41Y]KOY49139.1 glucose dehydrogenase [Gordonia sp. NB41Y]WLP90130.1 PQQ-dependent sugar dehydrogenase [Gordonia sp. NB41Y]